MTGFHKLTQALGDHVFVIHAYRNLGAPDIAERVLRDQITPILKEADGYCGCLTFLTEQGGNYGLSLAVFKTLAQAQHACDELAEKTRQQQLSVNPPDVSFGQPSVFTLADPAQAAQVTPAKSVTDAPDAEKILQMAVDLYWEIRRGVRQINDEAETELGKWVNILSYAVDNSIEKTLPPLRAKDLMKRVELAIDIILAKPQGSLNLVRKLRHEIIMDIYRAEDKFFKKLIEFTNGSPSFTVVLGVATASLFFMAVLALMHYYPGINIFRRMDNYFPMAKDGPPVLITGSIEVAAIAAFAGSVVSVLTRLEQFEARRGVDPKLLFLNAVARPYIGAAMAMFVVAVQGFGLFSVAAAKPEEKNFAFFLIVVGFLSGFSERFATDFIGSVEGGLGSRRAPGRPATPA